MPKPKISKKALKEKYTTLAFLIMGFVVEWQRYYFSDGHVFYRAQIKKSAGTLVSFMKETYEFDSNIYKGKASVHKRHEDNGFEEGEDSDESIIIALDTWSKNEDVFPFFHEKNDLGLTNAIFQLFYIRRLSYLLSKLNLEKFPSLSMSNMEGTLHTDYIKWNGHINYRVLEIVNESFLKTMSDSDSLVIVADIRHSQDLMTYSPSPDLYEHYILKLSEQAQKIIKEEYGIFDRFTGDGFICYFNKYVSEKFGLDYYESAISVCRKIREVANSIISEWVSKIRKVPSEPIGLSIGIDTGTISYSEKNGNLYAIGDACVWATRMCSAGGSGDIVVNNIPYQHLLTSTSLSFGEVTAITKDGEKFIAHTVNDGDNNFVIS